MAFNRPNNLNLRLLAIPPPWIWLQRLVWGCTRCWRALIALALLPNSFWAELVSVARADLA